MLQSLEYKFKKYDLEICGEMGYVGFDKEWAEVPVHKSGGIMRIEFFNTQNMFKK